ncbi:MAG: DUF1861 family protein [bacterium]|nr:DUF1861 family protein [bacterium]
MPTLEYLRLPNNTVESDPTDIQFEIVEPVIVPKPEDIPGDHIAYNPSSIWTIPEGQHGAGLDIVYLRVEPDRSNSGTSHLGKSYSRPYIIDLNSHRPNLSPFDGAMTIPGEDPSLTRINRLDSEGNVEEVWLLGVVDAQPYDDQPDRVKSLKTLFYAGASLDKLQHVADGPEGMKDIRIGKAGDKTYSTALHVYGRPQPQSFSGNITHRIIPGLEYLNAKTIASAPFIDEELLKVGSGVWGGVNDVIRVDDRVNLLPAHRAWRPDDNGRPIVNPNLESKNRHYEAVLYEHDVIENTIREIGVLATANKFPVGRVKADAAVNLYDVVFTGGGYNGSLEYLTYGVYDGEMAMSKVVRSIDEEKVA